MTDSPRPREPHTEPPVAHVDALPAGARISEFEILSLLGVGGFGMVYRAYDHSLHRTVAIKEYMPATLAGRFEGQAISTRSSSDQQTLASGLRSFVSEARLLAQLEHPSLVKVYRFWEANNTAYMVMPLYSGMTFRQARLQLPKPPPEAWLRAVLWSILGALKYLHDNNIVHRDVSPDNIFLQDIGPPILLDLGAARRAITDSTQKHTAILKVNYAPIEQYAGASDMQQGPWTDLYSVAAVVHGCLCNEAPLPATFRVLRDGMPTFAGVAQTVQSHFGQSYSSQFVQAITHALAIQPEDRPQSVQAFCDEMALGAPKDIQGFVWRENLGISQSKVQIGTASGAPIPVPNSAVNLSAMHPTTVDLQVTSPYRDEVEPAHPTEPGPLAQDNTSLTSDSVFSQLGGWPDAQTDAASTSSNSARSNSSHTAAAAPASAETAKSADHGRAELATPRKYWLAAAALVVVVFAGAVALFGGEKQIPAAPLVVVPAAKEVRATPEAEIIDEVLVKSAPVVAQPASTAVRPVPPASATKIATPATSPGNLAGAVAPSSAMPAAPTVPGVANAASAPSVPKKPVAPASPSVKPPAVDSASGRSEGLANSAEARPAKASDRGGPVENCASNNFLTRPMCIFQECQKAEYSRLPYCVENRRRNQENAGPNTNR